MSAPSQQGNSNDSHLHPGNGNRPGHPLEDVLGEGAILQLQTGLFIHGRNRALHSGTAEPLTEDVKALEDHARAMARDTSRSRFDPTQNVHDQMHQSEYDRTLQRREEVEKNEAHARANLRDAELNLAKTPRAGEKPRPAAWLVAAFIVGITITVAPTLHDFVFHTLSDDLLAWFGALVSAGFLGCMLTLGILSGRGTSWTWIGTAAGVLLGIGLGAVRVSSAEGTGEIVFAIGLTVIEIAEVLLLEWLASGLRNREQSWEQRKATEDEAIYSRNAEQDSLSRWQALRQEMDRAVGSKIGYVEDRHNRSIHLPELEAVAVKAIVDGYNAGIAENVGRLRGVRRVS